MFSGLEVPDRAVTLDLKTTLGTGDFTKVVVTKGNRRRGTDSGWQALMQRVEQSAFELGEPGFFYPFWFWDLGLDNARITRLLRQH